MKKAYLAIRVWKGILPILAFISSNFLITQTKAQCVAQSGTIAGFVYQDNNNNGKKEIGESTIANVLVSVYNVSGELVEFQSTDASGNYSFDNLSDDKSYRIGFEYLPKYTNAFMGADNGTNVQLVQAPACNASLGLVNTYFECGTNPNLFTTCFVQGATNGANAAMETIVSLEYNFNGSSTVSKFAMHGETGPVWGLAWKSITGDLFSSSFIKQYSGLTSHGHGAIFRTKVEGNEATSTTLYTKMSDLGVDVGVLPVSDPEDCAYGSQVGKYGLGAMVISPAEDYLYVVNLYRKSIVKLPTNNPTAANTIEISIPNPGCSAGDFAPFALKYYNDKLYIGITCTEETNQSALNSAAVVYEMDLQTNTFTNIFSTNYLKGYWHNEPFNDFATQHWFTDIDFTDDGNMVIAFTDRIGHKYCNKPSNRLDHQFPDILMVWNNNGTWTLESNGHAGALTGSGAGNTQGPDGGEFFGLDHWITQPAYHPEIALGSIYVLPGTGSVVTTAYDPGVNSYSGGVQRYSTTDGSKLGAKELYIRQTTELFGKATGFGEIIGRCGLPKIQVGNLVWFDANKNGLQDAGEQVAASIPIKLLDAQCLEIGATTTDAGGQYAFSNLNPGEQYYLALPGSLLDLNYQLIVIDGKNYIFSPEISNNPAIDNNAVFNLNGCGYAIIPVKFDKTNHNLDIGLIEANGFDLALKNEIVSNEFSRYNELIDFRMTIYNQGGVPAQNIEITNYIPAGLNFNAADNPAWSMENGVAKTTLNGTLLPGSSTTTILKLRIISGELSKIVDVAEISRATDHQGIVQTDMDSTPDAISGNDVGGDVNTSTDNKIDDDGTIDEDDEDPAIPRVLDLALKQVVNDNCLSGGDCFNIIATVYNQGNVSVSSFNVSNYFHPLLSFDNGVNGNWQKDGEILNFAGSSLNPGESINIPLSVCVKEGVLEEGIVEYAEISEVKVNGSATTRDFDSNPDNNPGNDAGGKHSTSQDNYIFGTMDVEEDDHDPVYLGVQYIDLALILTTEARKINEGEAVCFDINIYNQGSQTISLVNIVDYIPAGLNLTSADWTMIENNIASKTIKFENGLESGATYTEKICFEVGDISGIYYIQNYAEINSVTDICGNDVSTKDIDSKADHNNNNDNGGHPQTETDNIINGLPSVDEDDHDPAVLINYDVIVSSCECLDNASNGINGQFEQIVTVRGPKGMTWYIDQVANLYNDSSLDPPAAPTPFVTGPAGYILTEVPYNSTISDYVLSGIYTDGQQWALVLKSTLDDYEGIEGGGCSYDPVAIAGTASLCTNAIQVYSAPYSVYGYHVTLSGGGSIISAPLDSSNITVQWGAIPGIYSLKFDHKSPFSCDEPGILNVAIGNPDLSMACKSQIQVSLDADCFVEVTPAMLVAGDLTPGAPYIVMLLDDKGNLLPGNVLTSAQAGKIVIGKLIEGCSGNSCWSTLKIEDKTPPVMQCAPLVEVSCYKVDQYPGPITTDNCGGEVHIYTLDSLVRPLYCHPLYNMYIDMTYQAIDKWGNKSTLCNQTIAVKRIAVNEIVFPDDIEMANALTCNNYETDEFGFPSSSVTGSPTIEGWPVYPNFARECNMGVSYIDRDFGYIGCARKIMRVWTVYEAWCTAGVILQDTQTIIIADLVAPQFSCPSDLTFSAGYGQCEAYASFPSLTNITDDCSNIFTVDIKYPGGFINNTNGGSAYLPVGIHKITYIVYDQCENRDSCSMIVTVLDKTPPVVVCDRTTVVGLNSFGEAYVYANTFDDGSYDVCGLDSMRVRRMDAGAPCGDNFGFRTTVDFCCADVGNEVMVELKVWDINGNANSCMVNVQIQDKTPPTIFCPDNTTISCEVDYDIDDLSAYGEATAQDACGVTMTEIPTAHVNQCRVGYIERIFEARDSNGVSRCTSYIYIQKPYGMVSITWPLDYATSNGCTPADLSPDNLPAPYNKPVFNDGVCDLVASSKEDQYFPFDDGQGSCFKILRTWTVIDWCRKDEPGYQPAVYQQIIKVSNTVAPTIEIDADEEACTDEVSCTEGFIDLFAEGNDDCTPDESLFWSYAIDFDFDGIFEVDLQDQGIGNEIDASGFYNVGTHRILFTFEDRCGNQTSEFHDFEIRNCKTPIASCINGTSISLQPMVVNGENMRMACISASSLNVSSSHPCGYDITYAFSEDVNDTIMCFNCTDLGIVDLTLYVIDIFGNYSVCETYIEVQNNNGLTINISVNDEVICNGQSTTLTVSGVVGNYIWNTGATTPSITVSPTTTTSYSVSVTSEDGCTLSASQQIIVVPNPVAIINITGGNATICAGQSATLTVTGGETYLWNTGATTASITVTPASTTAYTVTVSTSEGCTATATRTVTVNTLPNAAIAAVNPICVGQSATLIASGGGSYLWSNNATTASITVTPATTTTYTVTVTNAAGCTASASRSVTVNPLPTVSINNVSPICLGQSATLTATGTGSYLWSTGATSATIMVTPATTTTYTVTVTSTAGCTATASRTVTVNPLPTAAIGSVAAICAGATASLTATGGGSYLWSTGATTATINVTPATTTSYTVTVTSAAQCTATATATVTVNPLPVAAISGPNAICVGVNATLTASGGTSFIWNTVPAQTTASITVNPTTTTTYVVTVTNASGCTDTESKVLTVNPLPIATLTGDLIICLGESTTLTAGGGTSFNWNTTPPQTTASITVSPTTTTTYTVTVTNANGCTDTESATVTVTTNNAPVALCQNATVYLNAQGEIVLNPQQVNNGSAPGCDNLPLTFSVTPNQFFCNDINLSPITVTLTVSSSNGTTATCTAQVTVLDTLPPVISCPGNVTFNCATFNGLGGLPGATATDNCPPPTVTVQVLNATNSCSIGTITRTYTAVDASNNESECTQVITITGPVDPLTSADIVFPADITLNTCTSIDPSVTGNVVVNSANASCTNTSVSFVDVNLNPNTPCNFTIQRTWTVIDSCLLNINTGAGIFTDVQLIVVNDNQPPIISGYADITISSDTCPVQVNYAMGGVSITECSQFTVTNNSPFASNNNSGNPSGLYDEGIHEIIVTATDACGNIARDTFLITVIVTGNGQVICHKIVRNINDLEFVDVEAEEFVTVSGTCNQDTFTFTYSDDDITDTIGRYFCDDIGDIITVIYFWDNGVLFDSCRTLLTIQDPFDFCTGNIFRVKGTIITENQVPVKDVQVSLSGMPSILTDKEGKYLFDDMQADGDYMIKPLKNHGLTEGVSTLDLIMIQRHILGVTKLNSPYKLVAADVNNDDKISASDLVELRKAILGTSSGFKNNTSWKMIDGRYSFPDPSNPFNDEYPLYYELISPEGNKISDFVGVKIGDVNNTYTANAYTVSAPRSPISLTLNDVFVTAGNEFTAKIGINQVVYADGLQLEFDVTGLTDIELHSDIFNKEDMSYHVHDGKLLVVIAPEKTVNLGTQDFIYLTAVPFEDGQLSTMMRMSEDLVKNEIYENLESRNLAIKWNDETATTFLVKQNAPNPWTDKTYIICTAPTAGIVSLKVKDVAGSTLFTNEFTVVKGENELEIRSDFFQGQTGVFLYELTFGNETVLGKMIRIK